ncbi:MAG: gamma-glutamyl-gamma-aminobutyrate hydrolase family protein [Candidatus Doudnabacteria bacterium]|nr:gamma-glutamyl-gamma-aminobutyrate hydrolase family protein [Candidatus Doudnabacteria bacterium]
MPQALLIDNGSSYIKNLQLLLQEAGLGSVIIDYENLNESFVHEADLTVLSGGHKYTIANHADYYSRELELIRTANKPIIGICLGFELVAVAFESVLRYLPMKDKGLREIQVSLPDSIFDRQNFTVYESHQFAVPSVPSPLVALATSAHGAEIIKHESKPMYGFQFHPEVLEDKQLGDELFIRVIKKLLP